MSIDPSDEPLNIQIDTRLDSYKSWFDHDWAKNLGEAVDVAPTLSRYLTRLQFNWKVTARTCFLPWLVVDSINGTTKGFHKDRSFQERMAMLTEALNIKLMQNLNQPKHIKQEICVQLRMAASQMERLEIPADATEISSETIWKEFIGNPDFCMAVWGSQVQTYSQVFFHYEHFLTRCAELFELTKAKPRKLRNCEILKDSFDEHLGNIAGDEYVMDSRIHEARLARHALAHNGGLMTEKLKEITHNFDVDPVTEQILIMPLDVANLFHYLKHKVTSLCHTLVRLPEFQ